MVTVNPVSWSSTLNSKSLNGTSLSPLGRSPRTALPFTIIMGLLKSLKTQQAQPHTNRQLAAALPDRKDRFPLMLEKQHFRNSDARL